MLSRRKAFHYWIILDDKNTDVLLEQSKHVANISIMEEVRALYANGERIDLAQTLPQFWQFSATVPHDRIFGLLGIIRNGSDLPFEPDYEESVEAVFTKTTRFLMRDQMSLSMLQFAGIGYPRTIRSLPSWVPDWTTMAYVVRDVKNWEPKNMVLYAIHDPYSGEASSERLTSATENLAVEAASFDKIYQIQDLIFPALSPESLKQSRGGQRERERYEVQTPGEWK